MTKNAILRPILFKLLPVLFIVNSLRAEPPVLDVDSFRSLSSAHWQPLGKEFVFLGFISKDKHGNYIFSEGGAGGVAKLNLVGLGEKDQLAINKRLDSCAIVKGTLLNYEKIGEGGKMEKQCEIKVVALSIRVRP